MLIRRRPIKGLTFHSDQNKINIIRSENNLRRQTSRTSIGTVHIGRICLVIRTQTKAEVSIWSVEMFFRYRFLLDHRKLLLNVNCGVKVAIICIHVVSRHWTTRVYFRLHIDVWNKALTHITTNRENNLMKINMGTAAERKVFMLRCLMSHWSFSLSLSLSLSVCVCVCVSFARVDQTDALSTRAKAKQYLEDSSW